MIKVLESVGAVYIYYKHLGINAFSFLRPSYKENLKLKYIETG